MIKKYIFILLTIVICGLFGIFAGVIGTFAHKEHIDIAGFPVWFGLGLSILMLILICSGLSIIPQIPYAAFSFSVGVVLAILILGLRGVGGDSVLISADGFEGYFWAWGAPLVLVFTILLTPMVVRAIEDKPGEL